MVQPISSLIKDSWNVYRKNFAKILLAVIAVWIPLIIIQVVLIDPSIKLDGVDEILQNQELIGTPEYEDAAAVMMRTGAIYMAATLLISFLGLVSDIIITKVADKSHKSENFKVSTSFGDMFSDSVAVLPRCIWIVVLTALLTVFGLMMFFLPGIYIYIMSSLAVTAAVLVGVKGMKAIKMSFAVIGREFFTILIVLLIFIVVDSLIISGVDLINTVLPDNRIIHSVSNGFVMLFEQFIQSFRIVMLTVFFADRFKVLNSEHPKDTVLGAEL